MHYHLGVRWRAVRVVQARERSTFKTSKRQDMTPNWIGLGSH